MGLIVGLSGVDGSGKTTVAKLVMERLKDSGYEVTYHHELDFLVLKPLFRFAARLAGDEQAGNIKEDLILGAEQGRPLYSDIYYLLVWVDSFLAYIYFKLKRGIIIHDRWLYDFITFFDHKQYKSRLVKRLYFLFPRPDVFILLTVPEEIALQRKKGDISHINHDLQYYRVMASLAMENARRWKCDSIIDSSQPADKVASDVLAVIEKHLKKSSSKSEGQ